jgi:bacteriocin-like protein
MNIKLNKLSEEELQHVLGGESGGGGGGGDQSGGGSPYTGANARWFNNTNLYQEQPATTDSVSSSR